MYMKEHGGPKPAIRHILRCVAYRKLPSDTPPTVSLMDVSFSDLTPSLRTVVRVEGRPIEVSGFDCQQVAGQLSPLQSAQSSCRVDAACYSLGCRALSLRVK